MGGWGKAGIPSQYTGTAGKRWRNRRQGRPALFSGRRPREEAQAQKLDRRALSKWETGGWRLVLNGPDVATRPSANLQYYQSLFLYSEKYCCQTQGILNITKSQSRPSLLLKYLSTLLCYTLLLPLPQNIPPGCYFFVRSPGLGGINFFQIFSKMMMAAPERFSHKPAPHL